MTAGTRVSKLSATTLVDTHAHLELEPLFNDAAQVVERAKSAGIETIITVGIDLEDAVLALEVADRFPDVFACVGFHPHNAQTVGRGSLAELEKLGPAPGFYPRADLPSPARA